MGLNGGFGFENPCSTQIMRMEDVLLLFYANDRVAGSRTNDSDVASIQSFICCWAF